MSYDLLASESTVHVLATTDVIDAVRATIQSPTHRIIASSMVPQTIWGTSAGTDQLAQVAFDVDWLIDHTAATSAIGNQAIDGNGLLQQVVTFTVSYTPAGSTLPPVTATVDVPMPWLEEVIPPGGTSSGLDDAKALIDAEAAKLATMAGA
jgi:hypothetical protein